MTIRKPRKGEPCAPGHGPAVVEIQIEPDFRRTYCLKCFRRRVRKEDRNLARMEKFLFKLEVKP